MTITAEEFLRRFLLHTLPRGFIRIRFSGFFASRRRAALLPICQQLLDANSRTRSPTPPATSLRPALWICPHCGGPMAVIERLTVQQIQQEAHRQSGFVDTS
jgi:hypothetical protein